MIIRKFVIQVVAKFTDKGFRDADKEMAKLKVRAAELTKEYNALTRAQIAAAQAAKKAGDAADGEGDDLLRLQLRVIALDEKIEDLNDSIGKKRKRLDELSSRSLKDVGASFSGASDKLGKFRSTLAPIGEVVSATARAMATLGAAGVAVGAGVIKVGTEFESLRAQLKTVEGSVMGADRSFNLIKDFAAKTPFQVENLTSGFIALRVRGVEPTTDMLTGLGDLASAFGQDFGEVTDAIAAAARGELDPIEKFGISAKIAGDKIALSFKGQKVEIERSAEAVTNALVEFGKMKGVQGAMADQSVTTAGVLSNLQDTFASFMDEIAQMGVLDEFKLLLNDVSNAAGGQGFAGIIAEALVTGLRALREALANVTEQDIREFLQAAVDLAKSFADVLGLVTAAIEVFTIASGNSSDALGNMTLAVMALIAAFTGPAGLTVAAAAVGVVMGRMLANVAADLDGTNASIDKLDRRIAKLTANIDERNARIDEIENRTQEITEKTRRREKEMAERRAKRLEQEAGGLGSGLIRGDLSKDDLGFKAQFIQVAEAEAGALGGVSEEGPLGALSDVARKRREVLERRAEAAKSELFTGAGLQVYEGVRKAEAKKVADIERRARREAKKSGKTAAEIEAAASAARSAAENAAAANRRKAFEAAQKTFTETGSAEAATLAGQREVAGRGKKGAVKKGKAGKEFFDFEKKAEQAAKTQGETFAERELQRLISEGVSSKDALVQAQAAGKKRADELKERFLEAGRIFDDSANNVLDLLGLRGPGSVLEGRPPPQTLIIAPVFTIKFIENFNQTIESVPTAAALAEVTGEAGQAAVEAGLTPNLEFFNKVVNDQLALRMQEIANALGGGRVAPGPQG